ncbi:response regulator transcription factor [Actinopolymorpha pittospori]|uniref:Two-component system OmpR family response regulator n=1 Tax=Actinopolymorpha pittospori TaxID=648752 RepID=A0A927MNV1_9ACTN|nr:response regulator transcription factor [Actinopolymorpha pittospori]MBE1603329.1 two-component system OmpR family response regulator [Actinopolymorpha pittospori]
MADGVSLHSVRIMVVDDERDLAEMIASALRYEGWDTTVSTSAEEALKQVRDFDPAAIVLDVLLPDADGFAVLEKFRAMGVHAPVIFLTALGTTQDRVRGLTVGGDDYVVKPFDLEELVARLRVVLRRGATTTGHRPSRFQVDDLVLNEGTHEVRRGERLVELTPTEFELLSFLMRNSPTVVSKAQILDHVWRYDFGGNTNVVELYISYLRRKMDNGRDPLIHTVRGVGYVVRPPVPDQTPMNGR